MSDEEKAEQAEVFKAMHRMFDATRFEPYTGPEDAVIAYDSTGPITVKMLREMAHEEDC